MFKKSINGNGRWASITELPNGKFRVWAAMDSQSVATNFEDYAFKAKAIRVAKDWIEYGA